MSYCWSLHPLYCFLKVIKMIMIVIFMNVLIFIMQTVICCHDFSTVHDSVTFLQILKEALQTSHTLCCKTFASGTYKHITKQIHFLFNTAIFLLQVVKGKWVYSSLSHWEVLHAISSTCPLFHSAGDQKTTSISFSLIDSFCFLCWDHRINGRAGRFVFFLLPTLTVPLRPTQQGEWLLILITLSHHMNYILLLHV